MHKPPAVLIVDDSKLARMLARQAITSILPDAVIREAADGKEAEAAAAREHFDVALIDVNMPGENGFQVAGRMRAANPDLKLAICSANIQEASKSKAGELDAAFVAKPISAEKIKTFFDGG